MYIKTHGRNDEKCYLEDLYLQNMSSTMHLDSIQPAGITKYRKQIGINIRNTEEAV